MKNEESVSDISKIILGSVTMKQLKDHLEEYFDHLKIINEILDSISEDNIYIGITVDEETNDFLIGIKMENDETIYSLCDLINESLDIKDGYSIKEKKVIRAEVTGITEVITNHFKRKGVLLGLADFEERHMIPMVMINNLPFPLLILISALNSVAYESELLSNKVIDTVLKQ